MNNNVNNTNKYIDPKTGSGYVSAGNNKMDGPVLLVIVISIIAVLGGVLFVVSNSENLWEDFKDKMIEVSEDLEDTEEDYEDEYIDYEDTEDMEDIDYITEDEEDSYYDENDYSDDDLTYSISEFKEINARDIYNESRGNTIVLWVGRQSCGFCAMYAPVMENVASDFGIVARYIDLEKIINFNVLEPYIEDDIAFTILSNLSGKGKWMNFARDNMGGTPLTLIIKDNQVIGGVSGYVEESSLTKTFIDAGLRK